MDIENHFKLLLPKTTCSNTSLAYSNNTDKTDKTVNLLENGHLHLVLDKYNKKVNLLYNMGCGNIDEIEFKEHEAKDLFNGGIYSGMLNNLLTTNICFIISEDDDKMDNDLIQHFPYTSQSYVYIDYNQKIDNIYFVIPSDSKFDVNPNVILLQLPMIITEFLDHLNKIKLIHNSMVSLTTNTDYIDNNTKCCTTNKLLDILYNAINSMKKVKCLIKKEEESTQFNVVDDELIENENKEEVDKLPDEYVVYNKEQQILRIYMKLSKLRKSIDIVRKKLIVNYIKERLVKNKLTVNTNKSNIMNLFLN